MNEAQLKRDLPITLPASCWVFMAARREIPEAVYTIIERQLREQGYGALINEELRKGFKERLTRLRGGKGEK
jgi:hypothetical protein